MDLPNSSGGIGVVCSAWLGVFLDRDPVGTRPLGGEDGNRAIQPFGRLIDRHDDFDCRPFMTVGYLLEHPRDAELRSRADEKGVPSVDQVKSEILHGGANGIHLGKDM